jgi:hypothetical protein
MTQLPVLVHSDDVNRPSGVVRWSPIRQLLLQVRVPLLALVIDEWPRISNRLVRAGV